MLGEIFGAQALAAYTAFTPTGTVVPDNFATFDSFLQDRFGFAVLNGGAALDPLGAGIEIAGVTGSVIGDGIAGRLGPSLFGGRDTISLVGPAAPTFRVTSPPPLGSDILGDRTSYEQSITAPGQAYYTFKRPLADGAEPDVSVVRNGIVREQPESGSAGGPQAVAL